MQSGEDLFPNFGCDLGSHAERPVLPRRLFLDLLGLGVLSLFLYGYYVATLAPVDGRWWW